MREFLKEELVQVKMTVLWQNWKWVSCVVHSRLVPLIILYIREQKIRYCHADHLSASSATFLEQDPTLQLLDLSSSLIKKPVKDHRYLGMFKRTLRTKSGGSFRQVWEISCGVRKRKTRNDYSPQWFTWTSLTTPNKKADPKIGLSWS